MIIAISKRHRHWNNQHQPHQLCTVVQKTEPLLYFQINSTTRRRLESAYIRQVYTIMLWCTRLHVYIRASLVMYMRSRRLPMIMTSSIMTACCGVTGVCGKSIGSCVNIFVHFFSTPISILNLAMSSESQENDVSNDILSERKYSQLFTHESNTFLLKQL